MILILEKFTSYVCKVRMTGTISKMDSYFEKISCAYPKDDVIRLGWLSRFTWLPDRRRGIVELSEIGWNKAKDAEAFKWF